MRTYSGLSPSGPQRWAFAPSLCWLDCFSASYDLLYHLWLRFSNELAPEEIHHHDIVHFALSEMERELTEEKDGEVREGLKKQIESIKTRREPHL